MPLKLRIASSRKIGEPNYGSRGATVGLEMEVDSHLVDHPRQFHERIAGLFRLAKQSVNRELGRPPQDEGGAGGYIAEPASVIRPATNRQVRAIHVIARRRELDLDQELQDRFSVTRPEELSLDEASRMIDALSSANGAQSSTDAAP